MSTRESAFSFLDYRNALLGREMKTALRNDRAFLMMAIYIALLGVIVVSQFPAQQSFSVESISDKAPGSSLFFNFSIAQALLVMIVLPALAAGALAQERENRTLEPLLLTPLTTWQIVVGKAAGVLAFSLLLLAASIPLSALSFPLGGVSPTEFIGTYVMLFGLAGCVTALGLYCSSRYENTMRATLMCYATLIVAAPMVTLFTFAGSILSGLLLLFYPLWLLGSWLQKRKTRPLAARHPALYQIFVVLLLVVAFCVIVVVLFFVNKPGQFYALFIAPYLALLAWLGLRAASVELMRTPTERIPNAVRAADAREEWRRAMAVASQPAPMPTGRYTYTPQNAVASPPLSTQSAQATASTHAAASQQERALAPITPTYHPKAFLSEKTNPVLGRELRSGMLGKATMMGKYGLAFFLFCEFCIGFYLFFSNSPTSANAAPLVRFWGGYHLLALMVLAATFGARTIAPEHEQGTLLQLLMTPLSAMQVLGGKIGAVLLLVGAFIALAALPAILLTALGFLSWAHLLIFLLSEMVYGLAATALGVYCSMRAVTVRRALSWALGSVVSLLTVNLLISNIVFTFLTGPTNDSPALQEGVKWISSLLFPSVFAQAMKLDVLGVELWLRSMVIFALAALAFFVVSARSFRRHAIERESAA